jgi:putative redox protein
MTQEKITFAGHSGDMLAARLDRPKGKLQTTAIFAHCFTCSKDIAAARRISQRLASMGVAVLRFDFTGLGHSGGEFANTDFSSNVEDLVLAARYLEQTIGAPQLLIGHSLGGAAVLRAAGDIPSAKAIVTIGAPSDPGHVLENFGSTLQEIEEEGAAQVRLADRSFTIRKSFIDDVSSAELLPRIAKLNRALLVMHSPVDEVVGIDNASDIFVAAKHPKSFVTLDKADHLLTAPQDAEYAAEVIAAWASRYIDLTPRAAPEGAPEGIVRSSESGPDGYLQDISAGPRHHILADEPVDQGGTDLGMTPHQLVSAALAACTSITLRMYAGRKKWPLEHIYVDVTHNKMHAKDCEDCESTEGMVSRFSRTIHLTGDLTEDQRTRMMGIANKCPVHRTLTNEVSIRTELAD